MRQEDLAASRGFLDGFVPRGRAGAGERLTAEGVALFCDVVGFTALTDRLVAEQGRRKGAETARRDVERAIDRALRIAAGLGGEALAFAGDALTLWFEGPGSAGRAATCALALAAPDAGGGLRLRLSVAAGEIERVSVGSARHGRMELVGGTALTRVSELDARNAAQGVLVDERLRRQLAEAGAELAPAGPGAWRLSALHAPAAPGAPPAPGLHDDAIDWVPAPVRPTVTAANARAIAGDLADLSEFAEIRPVTALFVHLGSLAATGTEHVRALVDRVQTEVQGRGGTVLNVNSDAKGSYISCLFGAPTAHEDDTDRALDAAVAIATPAEDAADVDIRIGLSRGSALVGVMGIATRPRYDAIGAALNRAARLMIDAGRGEVLVAAELSERAARRHRVGPVTPTGRGGAAFRLGAPLSAPAAAAELRSSPAPELLERAAALEEIEAALADSQRRTIVLEAPPGFGKSTLLGVLRTRAEAAGTLWLQGRGDELYRDRAMLALGPVFEGLPAAASEAGEARAILSWAADQSQPAPPGVAGSGGSERAVRIAAALSELVSHAARTRPVVLALDDGHWVDSVTWAVLFRAIVSGAPLTVLVSRRPSTASTMEGAMLLESPGVTRVTLAPLSDEAVLATAANELGVNSLALDLGQLIVRNAGGSPLFAQEIARVLDARGLLRREGGHVTAAIGATRLAGLDFTESFEAAILARFDTLPAECKQVARAASVLGGAISRAALTVAAEDSCREETLDTHLATLVGEGYLVAQPGEAGAQFAFRHPLVRDAINESITFASRARLNARLAEWWAGQGGGPDAMHRRARHLLEAARAGEADSAPVREAIAALRGVADQSMADYAMLEASWLLEDALDLSGRLPPGEEADGLRLALQSSLAFCLASFRGYGDPTVEAAYRQALEVASDAKATQELAFVIYGIFSFYSARGDYAEAIPIARRLHRLARRFDDLRLAAVAHQSRGIVALLRGRPAAGGRLTAASIADLERRGDGQVFSQGGTGDFRIYTGTWLALSEAVRGRDAAADAAFGRALALSRGQAFAEGFLRTFCPLPVLRGDPAAAVDYAEPLVAAADARGFALFSVVARIYLGWAQALSGGGAAGAREMLEQNLHISQSMKLDSFTPFFLALGAEARLADGDAEGAAQAVETGRAVVARTGGRLFLPVLLRVAAGLPGADAAALRRAARDEAAARGSHLFARMADASASPRAALPIH